MICETVSPEEFRKALRKKFPPYGIISEIEPGRYAAMDINGFTRMFESRKEAVDWVKGLY
ncbi:MAG: hypothetical protein Q4C42_11765 [Clostridia bacterium]|nr:hypothetical protein [Clostridia bacterium]